MDWNQITELPLFWQPFHSLTFTLIARHRWCPALLAPSSSALAMFKRRVGGTYFAIITQAVAAILTILIVGQQGYTGGINGMTDLRTLQGWDIRPDHAKIVLYFFEVGLPVRLHLHRAVHPPHSKLGRILVAMRDKEDRVRFSGYDVANFKIFAFCVAAVLRRDRRRDVRAPCRIHVAVLRRHRALDRDGDLQRGRRPASRSSARSTARCWSTSPRPVCRRPFPSSGCSRLGGAVHRGGAGLPERPGRHLARLRAAAARPADAVAQAEPADAAGPTVRSPTAHRPSEEMIMLIGHQPKDFLLAVEALTVSFDGFKAVNDLSFYVDENEIRVIIGPNGAGKTTVLDLICGKTKATAGSIKFKGQELTEHEGTPDRAGRRRPQVPDTRRSTKISRCSRTWRSRFRAAAPCSAR